MRCRKCGKDNPEGSQFCGYCGEALQQDNMNLQTKMNGGEDKKEQKKDRGRKGGRKWIWAAGAVLVIGVAAASFFITRSVQERQAYDDNLASGEKYLEELDYENAEASYLKAIEIDPKQERPYVALAQMYMDQGEVQKAKDILEQGAKVLRPRGRFYMVHRPFRLAEILSAMVRYKIEPKRMRLVYPYVDKEPNLVLIEGMRGGRSRMTVEKPLIVYEAPGVYAREVLDIYGQEWKK